MRLRGIGQAGLGSISVQHRAGYRAMGLPVVAGFDPDPAAGNRFQLDVPEARAYTSIGELLDDPEVEIVDVAAPHVRSVRVPLVRAIADAGKAMLIQKPLAATYQDALELARLVEDFGVTAMVNQNMCFAPAAIELEKLVLRDGAIGDPAFAFVQVQYRFDTGDHPWFGRDERWWTSALTVHHLGLLQLLFGPPLTVYAMLGRDPGQPGVLSDGYGHLSLVYPNGMQVIILSTGTYFGAQPRPHEREQIWIQGSAGIIDWQADGEITVSQRAQLGDVIDRRSVPLTVPGKWFPHAFGLTMLHLQQAVDARRTPLCSVSDNLYVVGAIEAAYRSGAENRAVPLEEVMGDRYDPGYGPGWGRGFSQWTPPDEAQKGTA